MNAFLSTNIILCLKLRWGRGAFPFRDQRLLFETRGKYTPHGLQIKHTMMMMQPEDLFDMVDTANGARRGRMLSAALVDQVAPYHQDNHAPLPSAAGLLPAG